MDFSLWKRWHIVNRSHWPSFASNNVTCTVYHVRERSHIPLNFIYGTNTKAENVVESAPLIVTLAHSKRFPFEDLQSIMVAMLLILFPFVSAAPLPPSPFLFLVSMRIRTQILICAHNAHAAAHPIWLWQKIKKSKSNEMKLKNTLAHKHVHTQKMIEGERERAREFDVESSSTIYANYFIWLKKGDSYR